MKAKTLKRISFVSLAIIVAIVLALTLSTLLSASKPKAQAAAGTLYTAEYQGDNGTLPEHITDRQVIANKHGVEYGEVVGIAFGGELFRYLNGEAYTDYKVAYLVNDVGISYNSIKDGYDKVDVSSSSAIFDKVLDGNGYTVKIYGGAGECNSNTEIRDDDGYRYTRRQGEKRYAGLDIWYEYTGYLVAENYGKIVNLTIDYTSPHTVIEAVNGHNGTGNGDLGIATSNRLMSKRQGLFVAGIVTGINGYGGVIDNVRVNIQNAFTAIKMASTNTGYFTENTVYAGGIAGRIEDESTISNCQVDIASGAGVFAGAQGKPTNFPNFDKHYSMGIAGGIVGNIDKGTGKINYCVLSGSGQVKAFANRATNTSTSFQAYAGGVSGGCIYIWGAERVLSGTNDTKDATVNKGQIKGIISSWTGSRFSNYNNVPQSSMGSLFESVGDDDVVESIALLYDLETLMDNNTGGNMIKPTASDGKVVLDSSARTLKSWLSIHPTSEGGTMTVKFDTENPTYDIRVHIVADGHDEFKNSGVMDEYVFSGKSRYYQYKLNRGEGGGIIWSGTFANANDSSNHINLNLDDPIYAEIYLISSSNSGSYNYEFGTMGTLAYTDTNGTNGNLVRAYEGAGTPLQLPSVRMTNNAGFDTSVFNNESLWQIQRGSTTGVALSQTYMPGTYRMRVETKLGERTYGYYNEAQRMLAWQPMSDYVFTILQGELRLGDSTTATDGWQNSVTFELKMNSRSDFDTIEFKKNGVFPSDSAKGFKYEGASAFYTVSAGTGKNGTAYSFCAYKYDDVLKENVLVAESVSTIVRIDDEAPEVSEIEYYMVEDGVERLLTEDDIEDIQANWTKNTILAKYSVSDNEKSGIASAATEPYITETVLNNYGDREVVVEITDSTPKELLYIDGRGNTTQVDLQFNVDRVEGRLSFAGSSYKTEGRFNYSTKNVSIRYKAFFGASGWRLYYSYQRDTDGEDIWVASPELMEDSGAVKTFTIDWNMGNVSTGIGDDFKIKMVNEAGLYEEEVFPLKAEGTPYENNVIGTYIIWLRIANIYLDNNLNNIFVEGEDKSVQEILQSEEERAKYFDKEYDGTDEYTGKKEYKFYTDLSKLGEDGFYYTDKLGVIYSPAGMSRPRINLGSNGIVPVELKYETSEVGEVKLSFQVVLTGVDGYNYIVYFTDLANIDFEEDVEVEEGTYSETFEITAKINKRKVQINLDEQEAFDGSKHYYYGDEIPTSIEVYVASTDEYVTLQIKTDASATANVNEYTVEGIAPDGYANIEYVVNSTSVSIEQRHISIDLRYDDGSVGNIPTGVQAGKTHKITGTYEDVNGDTQDAIVKYYLKDAEVKSLGAVGEYRIEVSITDTNYVIDGQTSFRFNIAKGFLEIGTGLRIKDFTEDQVEYDLIIADEAKELYAENEIKLTYYEYLEGATYNASTNEIIGKTSTEPMAGAPTERGLYYVKIDYIPNDIGNGNFFAKSYEGNMIIERAKTQVNVEKVVLEYYYTAEMYTFNLVDAVAEVRSSSNKQLWSSSFSADGVVKVQYKDATGSFVDVAASPKDGGGWYSETGRYEYRISYNGSDDYNTSAIDVVMVINKSELKGITFNSVETVYNGNKVLPTVGGLLAYPGLKVTFQYGLNKAECDGSTDGVKNALNKFDFVNAREYTVYMTVEKDGYETKELTAKVNIKKAKMEGIGFKLEEIEYDGKRHNIQFTGFDDYDGTSYKYKGETVIIKEGNSEGNAYATNVYIEPGVGPSYHTGQVTFSSSNYEDLVIKTQITIKQAVLPYKELGKDLPNKLPSGTDLTEYMGYFVDEGDQRITCKLQYRDKDDNIVELDENGTLADGRYSVRIVIPNDNFYIDRYWEFDIGEINDPSISTIGIVAIAVVGVLLVGATVTAIVVVKKRKKAGIV